jgi:hypothetical protein
MGVPPMAVYPRQSAVRRRSSKKRSALLLRGGRAQYDDMRARLLNAATVASLLVAIGIVPLWHRSVTRRDAVTFLRSNGVGYHLATYPHGLDLGWSDGYAVASRWIFPHLHPGWNRTVEPYGVSRQIPLPSGHGFVSGYISYTTSYPEPAHRLAGFAWDSQVISMGPPFVAHPTSYRAAAVYLPFAFLLPACLALPAWRLWAAVRRRRLRIANRCLGCGYDLRASPDRCPECGAAPAA